MNTRATSDRRRMIACLVGINALIYGLNAAFSAFMPVYLSENFSSIVKGKLLAVACVVSIIAPVLIGKITDKASSKAKVLATLVGLSAVFFFACYFGQNVWYLGVLMALLSFCRSAFGGLVDTTTLEYTAANDIAYGPIRLTGTLGFGLVALILGIAATDNLGFAFAAYPVIAVFAIVCLLKGPQVPGHAAKKEKLQVLPILKDRNIVILFLINGTAYFAFMYYQHFYNEYVLGYLNLPTWIWGLNVFATITMELPFFILFDRIMKKVSLKTMLVACLLVSVARYLLLPVVTTPVAILCTGALTGGWITFITYCVTLYIKQHMKPSLIASSIGLQYALAIGIGTLAADFGGGYLTSFLGVRGGLFFCSAVCALVLPTVFLIRTKPQEG